MIYFIRNGEYIKIGVADNPWSRLTSFQIGNPSELELLAVAPGSFEEESVYHNMLHRYHKRGEWYQATEPVLELVQSVREKYHKIQTRPVMGLNSKPLPKRDKNKRAPHMTPVDAVRLVVNTAVVMAENEPAIDIMSVTEGKRGPGILIWIPGYIDNSGTIIVAGTVAQEAEP